MVNPVKGLDEDINPLAIKRMAEEQGTAAVPAGLSAWQGCNGRNRGKIRKDERGGIVTREQFIDLTREQEPEGVGAAEHPGYIDPGYIRFDFIAETRLEGVSPEGWTGNHDD